MKNGTKWFACVGMLLFLGVAVAPSICGQDHVNEYVEGTIEFCGLGKRQFVHLSMKDAADIIDLFDGMKNRMDDVRSYEQLKEIVNDGIDAIDSYGLLGDLRANHVKHLITGKLQSSGNRCCLILGRTSQTSFYGPVLTMFTQIFQKLPFGYAWGNFRAFLYVYQLINIIRPVNFFGLGHTISVGKYVIDDVSGGSGFRSASGWITSFGLNGFRMWNGSMFGNLSLTPFEQYYGLGGSIDYPGVVGFIGLKIDLNWDETNWLYLGSALKAEIDEI
jgi:hypothetical protein